MNEGVPRERIALDEVWTRQPTAIAALGRRVGRQVEQFVALENETVMPGDNFLLMRGYLDEGGGPFEAAARVPGIAMADFLRRSDGFPPPFDEADEGQLRTGEDAVGVYVWAQKSAPHSVNCVLVMRRVLATDVLLPQELRALDVMMRNCVAGDLEEAMAPIAPESIGWANAGARNDAVHSLQLLAGPKHVGRAPTDE